MRQQKLKNYMKILISPVSLEEAFSVVEGGVDIIDIKNVNEGSLGAQFPWKISEMVKFIHGKGITASATIGDLPYKPGMASLAAYGVAHCQVDYVKAGLYGLNTYEQALEMMVAIRQAVYMIRNDALVVASGYADYRYFNGLPPWDLVHAAKDAQCDGVMLDTAIKDGHTLFDVLALDEINDFVSMAKEANLLVALAGSIQAKHAEALHRIQPDIIGVRGAVCEGTNRHRKISAEKTRAFINLFRN